jgi:hypothetical protein
VSEFESPAPSAQDDFDKLMARRREGRFADLKDPLRKYLAFSTEGRVPARAIMAAVEEAITERYGLPSGFRVLPPGLRLEMHPSVRRWLMVSDDTLFRYAARVPDDLFSVPVLVTAHLPEDRWRLVIVTEEVILGGGIHGENPGG